MKYNNYNTVFPITFSANVLNIISQDSHIVTMEKEKWIKKKDKNEYKRNKNCYASI